MKYYVDYFTKNIMAVDRYVSGLDYYHTCLTRTIARVCELRGELDFAMTSGAITCEEYENFIDMLGAIKKRIRDLLNSRAKWTAERLEDYLGENPSVHRVAVNVYNDLLDNLFEEGFTLGGEDAKKDRC